MGRGDERHGDPPALTSKNDVSSVGVSSDDDDADSSAACQAAAQRLRADQDVARRFRRALAAATCMLAYVRRETRWQPAVELVDQTGFEPVTS
jgi:hypothetical protein